jgi:hypothetical protein
LYRKVVVVVGAHVLLLLLMVLAVYTVLVLFLANLLVVLKVVVFTRMVVQVSGVVIWGLGRHVQIWKLVIHVQYRLRHLPLLLKPAHYERSATNNAEQG